jgi:hypothetical protein
MKDFKFKNNNDSDTDLTWIGDIVRAMASVVEVLLWAGIILLVIFLIVKISQMVNPDAFKSKDKKRAIPAVISGMDIRPESLPDDVAATAKQLWQQGDYREAMSLLYRGTVSSLVHAYEVELSEGATEGDVLIAAQSRLQTETHDYLDNITRSWQSIAYAHRPPEDARALSLFDHWQQHFGQTSAHNEVLSA